MYSKILRYRKINILCVLRYNYLCTYVYEKVFLVYGCYVHLRIVHQTDGPAWMNHLTNCPVYHFATVTFRHQLACTTQRIHHRWSDH